MKKIKNLFLLSIIINILITNMKNSLFIIILNILIFMSIKAQEPIEAPLKHQQLCQQIINFEVHPTVYFLKLYDGINLFSTVFEPYSRIWEATPYQIEQEKQMFIELKALFDGYSYILSQIYKKVEDEDLELKLTGVRSRLRVARKFLNEPVALIERNQRRYNRHSAPKINNFYLK